MEELIKIKKSLKKNNLVKVSLSTLIMLALSNLAYANTKITQEEIKKINEKDNQNLSNKFKDKEVDGDVNLSNLTETTKIKETFKNSNIKGSVDLSNLRSSGDITQSFKNANIKGNVDLKSLKGPLNDVHETFEDAKIGGNVDLHNLQAKGLYHTFKSADIKGKVDLSSLSDISKHGLVEAFKDAKIKEIDLSNVKNAKADKLKNAFDKLEADKLTLGSLIDKNELGKAKAGALGDISKIKNIDFKYQKGINDKSLLDLFTYRNMQYYLVPDDDLSKFNNAGYKDATQDYTKLKPKNENGKYINDNSSTKNGDKLQDDGKYTLVESPFIADKRFISRKDIAMFAKAIGAVPTDPEQFKDDTTSLTGDEFITLMQQIGLHTSDDGKTWGEWSVGKDNLSKELKNQIDDHEESIDLTNQVLEITREELEESIEENTQKIEKNEKNIKENQDKLKDHDTKINANTQMLKTHTEQILKNTTDIAKLQEKSDIAISGVAGAFAVANIPQISSTSDKKYNISAGLGHYEGETALALGLSGISDNNSVVYKMSTSVNTRGKFGFGGGIGFQLGKKTAVKGKEYSEIISRLENTEAEIIKLKTNKEYMALLNRLEKAEAELSKIKSKMGKSQVELYVIDFYQNSIATLSKAQKIKLEAIVKEINTKYKDKKIYITGYTDTNDSDKYNLELGLQRANIVSEMLIELGLKNPQNIKKVSSTGYNNIVKTNNTKDGMASNRRVEIEVK